MINTILLDLDGTLLPMDTDTFTKKYFSELAIKLKDYFTLEELTKALLVSTEYMARNIDVSKTNEKVFFEKFYEIIEANEAEIKPLIDEFYELDFYNIKDMSQQNKYMLNAIELLKEKNYELVLASNPIFPKSAMIDRVKWSGASPVDFKFISGFEDMHFCKPHLEFYEELLKNTDKDSAECLMVGNSISEDMIASKIGIKTYLIEDFASGDKSSKDIDYSGSYKDFYEFVERLPKV